MNRLLRLIFLLLFLVSAAHPAGPKYYQVTGPLPDISSDVIVIEKGNEKWEIARNKDTQIYGDLKRGSRAVVRYAMTAKSIAVNGTGQSSPAIAVRPKHYQVTGVLLDVADDVILIEKGNEKWEIALARDTQIYGDLRKGSRATVRYMMMAKSIAVKESSQMTSERAPGQVSSSAAQGVTFRRVQHAGDLIMLFGTDEVSKTTFWLHGDSFWYGYPPDPAHLPCGRRDLHWLGGFAELSLLGEVPKEVSLLDDNLARNIIIRAVKLVKEKCGSLAAATGTTISYTNVQLYQTRIRNDLGGEDVRARVDPRDMKIYQYENNAIKAQQAKLKEIARGDAWRNFTQRYGVRQLVGGSELFTNPFVYERQTIAVRLQFERMIAPNSGLFQGDDSLFVISGLPTGTYRTKTNHGDVLVVRFTGMTEVKGVPFAQTMQVPSLQFVGVHFCSQWDCSDILPVR